MEIFTKLLFYVILGSNSPTKHPKITFVWGFCLIFFALVSCNPIEEEQMLQDKTEKLLKIQKMIEENGFEFEFTDSKTKNGIKVENLSELDDLLKVMIGKNKGQKSLNKILTRNGLKEIPNLNFTSFEVLRVENKYLSSNNRIECIQNWRNVYGRIGIGYFGSRYIDIGFSVGTGSGLIENFFSSYEGLTFMTTLGKNHFINSGYATALNGFTYSGIFHFSIRALVFFEGIGEVFTILNKKIQISVDACSGEVTYNLIEE
jgi:hypothetical protein